MSKISRFDTYYLFLSNFALAPIVYQGKIYASAEHAYQAAKVLNEVNHELVRTASTSGKAKRLGRKYADRPDWDQVKLEVMREIVWEKFLQNDDFAEELLATGNWLLEEGNHWGDTFWGVCHGKGENHLGKIIMEVRERLRLHQQPLGWATVAPKLLGTIPKIPIDYRLVYEKIGEELAEFQEEIDHADNFDNLLEESVDLVVTSLTAVESVLRLNPNLLTQVQWTVPEVVVIADTNSPFQWSSQALSHFIRAFGVLAKKQRSWRKKQDESSQKEWLDSACHLVGVAFYLSTQLGSEKKVLEIFERKIAKWSAYSSHMVVYDKR